MVCSIFLKNKPAYVTLTLHMILHKCIEINSGILAIKGNTQTYKLIQTQTYLTLKTLKNCLEKLLLSAPYCILLTNHHNSLSFAQIVNYALYSK